MYMSRVVSRYNEMRIRFYPTNSNNTWVTLALQRFWLKTRMLHKPKLLVHLATLHQVHKFTSTYFIAKRLSNSG
jgi:hypothetical protein